MGAEGPDLQPLEKLVRVGTALRVSWNWTEHFGRRRRQTLPFARAFGNNGVSFRLFQLFPAEKPGGFPSPESGTGCMGSSTALSEQPPRGTDRRDRALRSPNGRPGGTHSQRTKRFPLRPLGHPRIEYGAGSGRGAPPYQVPRQALRTGPGYHVFAAVQEVNCPGTPLLFAPAIHSWAGCGDRNCDTRSTRSMASKFKDMKEVLKAWKHCGQTTSEKEATGSWSRN